MNVPLLALIALPSTNAPATNDIRAIKPPVKIPDFWIWVWTALGLGVAVLLFYLLWRWWRSQSAAARMVPPVPPHVRARQKLQAALSLIDQPKPFIIAVSDAIRLYLEERFDLRAPERTTEEFLFELQASPLLSERQKQILAEFLQRCDLVKFARYEPVRPELREIFDAGLRLVDETTPRLVAADLQPGAAPTAD